MGREARAQARVGDDAGEVTLLLEAGGLLLRGAIRRDYPRADLADVHAESGELRFRCGGEAVSVALGEPAATRWAAAIVKPLPSLREKLGLRAPVLLVGTCDDAALAAALAGATTEEAGAAGMIVARIDAAEDLAAALAIPGRLPIWAIYPKGKGVAFGDAAIRTALRAAGYRDTKSCAVSDRLTGTRYQVPAGG